MHTAAGWALSAVVLAGAGCSRRALELPKRVSTSLAEPLASPSAPPAVVEAGRRGSEVALDAGVPSAGGMGARLGWGKPLSRFFQGLYELETSKRTSDVVVTQFGDSHTASDLGTSVVRRALQGRFGDGGRGFVAIGKPWAAYSQSDVHTSMSKGFSPEKTRYVAGRFVGDGRFGLGGFGITSSEAADASVEVVSPQSRVELAYLEQPRGGSFEIEVDGKAMAKRSSAAPSPRAAFVSLDLAERPHHLVVRTAGDGVVRLFGATWDRAAARVVFDTLGINGAQIFTLLRLDAAHWSEALAHRRPDLVIFAYGTNEAVETFTMAEYEDKWTVLVGRLRQASPGSDCLLLGPPDFAKKNADNEWRTVERVVEIDRTERRLAERLNCAYYSQYDAMGGRGSMANWAVQPKPLGAADRIHLSRDGYARLGQLFAAELITQYERFREGVKE